MTNFATCPMCHREAEWLGGNRYACRQGCRPSAGHDFVSEDSPGEQRAKRNKYHSYAESEARAEDRSTPRHGGAGW